ncbi:MAG: NADH-quinone oxidoreductase subunit N [Candidatus Hinthialibacter antarcticus]|nr:NADH-quinone oxidoreductase subunit N [Candidatus Hinthialibacter antarcticus]
MGNVESLAYFLPELVLTVTVMAVLVADICGAERFESNLPAKIALTGCVFAFLFHLHLYSLEPTKLFMGMLAHDTFALFFKAFFIVCTGAVTAMAIMSREVSQSKKSEFYAILLAVCIGMCLVASSRDLLMIYLALELMSLGSYVLAGFSRNIGKSDEAALKFVLYGGVSTGVMLFGISLLYGLTGATDFDAVHRALMTSTDGLNLTGFFIMLMILVGIGYKIAMVPFHFWAPDVYEGAPTAVTAYLSVASKATGFALITRFFFSTFMTATDGGWVMAEGLNIDWRLNLAVLSAITMTVGNLGAFPQTNLKRLLAYSGIAHAGYLLMGVCLMTTMGLESVLFYLVMYLFTNLTAFAVILFVAESTGSERITNFRGLWRTAPVAATMMAIAMFSLVGLPPTAGFVGKYYLFIAVLEEKMYWLAIVGVLNTVISLYYYMRIVKAMFLEESLASKPAMTMQPGYVLLLFVLSVPVLYFGLFWDPLVKYAQLCAHLLP